MASTSCTTPPAVPAPASFEAASEARDGGDEVWAIGVDSDQYNTADPAVQDVILTSMLKRVDVAVYNTIEALVNGEDVTGTTAFDLSVDGVGYSTSGGFVDEYVDSARGAEAADHRRRHRGSRHAVADRRRLRPPPGERVTDPGYCAGVRCRSGPTPGEH